MRFILILGFALLVTLSCSKEDSDIKRESGSVWLSGGLAYCAEQIRLDNGDTLTTPKASLISFKSGDKVNVKYRKMGINKNCTPYIDCEIIEITKLE